MVATKTTKTTASKAAPKKAAVPKTTATAKKTVAKKAPAVKKAVVKKTKPSAEAIYKMTEVAAYYIALKMALLEIHQIIGLQLKPKLARSISNCLGHASRDL